MKKKSCFNLYGLLLIVVGIVVSCTNKNFTDHVGPSICASDKFEYVNQLAVDSSTKYLNHGPEKITAKFNEQVPWTILITGQTSHSYKKYSGYGNSIDILWEGNPDTVVFFTTETCTVKLQVACKAAVTKTFKIMHVNTFSTYNFLAYNGGDGGQLGSLGGAGPIYGYPQPPYTTTPYNPLNGATIVDNSPSPPSPQGGSCICTEGNSTTGNPLYPPNTTSNAPVWYFGGFDISVTGIASYIKSDPSQVYFNCFINAEGSHATIPVVVFKEGTVSRSKSLYVYGSGWHYVSFKLSDVNIVDAHNISTVSFTLNSYPVQATSGKMCIDFMNFTNDAPFITTTTK